MISKILRMSNNRQVHYLEKGSGEPLVFVHGVGMRAEAWGPQIEYFSKNYRVIAVDMPGHGNSDKLDANAGLEEFVAWASEFLSSVATEPVNLAGHSMGSLIALGISVTSPDLVRRVAILNGVYKRTPQARAEVQARASALRKGEMDVGAPLARWFANDPAFDSIAEKVKSWLDAMDMEGYATAYSAFALGDDIYADQWSSVSCPALVLTGSEDYNSTAQMAETMANLAQNGMAIVLDGERHMPNLTAPDRVNASMQQWLEVGK